MVNFSVANSDYARLDRKLAALEEGLNFAGYIPVVSCASGAIRSVYGLAEAIAGVALAVFKLAQYWDDDDATLQREVVPGLRYAVHGLMNFFRGCVEQLFLVGNILTLLYDGALKVRGNYPYESLGDRVEPLFTQPRDLSRPSTWVQREGLLNELLA